MEIIKNVPVEFYKKNLLRSIKKFQITIIHAETGSGKTIFVPKILYESKLFKKILVSQTKRTAAITAAKFLSSILNEKIGDTVGYSIRFENKSGEHNDIIFMTDGILFQKLINNFLVKKNTCIIIDEFHERTLHTDLMICMLRKILVNRKDLKLIFMSASGNSLKLAKYFNQNLGKIDIPGSLFKIQTFFSKHIQLDFIVSLCSIITKLHLQEKLNSDFLVFLPGYREILECEKMLENILEKKCQNFKILKLHSVFPLSEQIAIFDRFDSKKRKIILSTNIAESSITIKGVKFVFDSGFSKQKILNWKTGYDLYKIFPISKSEAKQRAGRAGRISNGKCYRMFTYIDYSRFQNFPRPEIHRSELSTLFLHIFTSNFSSLFILEFIDLPPCWLVKRSLENLFILGAIDKKMELTLVGKILALYPIEIKLSKCLIESLKTGNKKIQIYMLLGCSMFSTNYNIFKLKDNFYSKNMEPKCKNFMVFDECFFIALLFKEFLSSNKGSKKYVPCQSKHTELPLFDLAKNIKEQLFEINKLASEFISHSETKLRFQGLFNGFRYCFTSGFFQNSARNIGNLWNLQIISTGVLVTINTSILKKNTKNLFLFYELVINHKPLLNGLISTRLPWLLYWGNKLFC